MAHLKNRSLYSNWTGVTILGVLVLATNLGVAGHVHAQTLDAETSARLNAVDQASLDFLRTYVRIKASSLPPPARAIFARKYYGMYHFLARYTPAEVYEAAGLKAQAEKIETVIDEIQRTHPLLTGWLNRNLASCAEDRLIPAQLARPDRLYRTFVLEAAMFVLFAANGHDVIDLSTQQLESLAYVFTRSAKPLLRANPAKARVLGRLLELGIETGLASLNPRSPSERILAERALATSLAQLMRGRFFRDRYTWDADSHRTFQRTFYSALGGVAAGIAATLFGGGSFLDLIYDYTQVYLSQNQILYTGLGFYLASGITGGMLGRITPATRNRGPLRAASRRCLQNLLPTLEDP
ncbi:MAG: hypothetical protein AB7G93_04520 [Bdellovibrionales bacterium]